MNRTNSSLRIDHTFRRLSIPLTEEQEQALEDSISCYGCQNPIIVWDDVILDGHKRYEFCRKNCIEFQTERKEFPSKDAAACWICMHRIPLYSSESAAYRYLVGNLYHTHQRILRTEKSIPEEKKTIRMGKFRKASYFTADQIHTSVSSVERNGNCEKWLSSIGQKSIRLFESLLSGEIMLPWAELQRLSQLDEGALDDYYRRKVHPENGRITAAVGKPWSENDGGMTARPQLSVGIKEMPAFDPDMELRGLALTIPTWIMSIEGAEKKTDMRLASDEAKFQLLEALDRLAEQIRRTQEAIQ